MTPLCHSGRRTHRPPSRVSLRNPAGIGSCVRASRISRERANEERSFRPQDQKSGLQDDTLACAAANSLHPSSFMPHPSRFRQGHRPLLGGGKIPADFVPSGLILVPLASLSPRFTFLHSVGEGRDGGGERAGDRGLLCHSLNPTSVRRHASVARFIHSSSY